jgi:hypothetical protein
MTLMLIGNLIFDEPLTENIADVDAYLQFSLHL